MKLTMMGTGYVGLVTGTGFANLGNDVICLDVDKSKVDLLQNGRLTIYHRHNQGCSGIRNYIYLRRHPFQRKPCGRPDCGGRS